MALSVRVIEFLLSLPLSALIVSVVWFGFMSDFFDMSDAGTSRFRQREDGSEYDEARSAYTPIDIDGAGRTGKSGAYLSLRERQFAELMAANSTRNHLGVVLQQLHTKGNAVEIGAGAGTGAFADVVLRSWDTPKYYIVDVNSGQDLPPLLDQHERRVEILNEYVEDAPHHFPDDHFSLIFINPSSSFRGLRSDLEDWFPKLQEGGILAGKNYCVSTSERDTSSGFDRRPWCGTYQSGAKKGKEKAGFGKYTVRAVDKFAGQMTRPVHFTLEGRGASDPFDSDGRSNPSWWLMK